MKGVIKERKSIARQTYEIVLDLDGQHLSFQPGQFFSLTLLNPPYTDLRGNSRFFGFTNSPAQDTIVSLATKSGTSAYKKSLFELPIGTEVEIGNLGGHISLTDAEIPKFVGVTSGIGIAPFMSIFRYAKENLKHAKITLIYSNPDHESAAFLNELQTLDRKLPGFTFIPTMTEDKAWVGETKLITTQFIHDYISDIDDCSFNITGIPAFATVAFKAVKEAGARQGNIVLEIFSGY